MNILGNTALNEKTSFYLNEVYYLLLAREETKLQTTVMVSLHL